MACGPETQNYLNPTGVQPSLHKKVSQEIHAKKRKENIITSLSGTSPPIPI